MDETSHEPVMVRQFLRRHFVRIVIGAVLGVVAYGVISVYATYQREQWITREINSHGGYVEFGYAGPVWIPISVQDRISFLLDRIQIVNLGDTQVTDAGLKHIKGLTNLNFLNLAKTQITDAGLEHLKGLTNLKHVSLQNTKVTAEGKAMLRKTLPKCKIDP